MVVRVSNSGGPTGTVSSREFTPPTSTEPDRRHPALRRRIHQDLHVWPCWRPQLALTPFGLHLRPRSTPATSWPASVLSLRHWPTAMLSDAIRVALREIMCLAKIQSGDKIDSVLYLSCCSERDVGLRNRQSSDRAEHKSDVRHAVTGQRAQFTHRLSSIC